VRCQNSEGLQYGLLKNFDAGRYSCFKKAQGWHSLALRRYQYGLKAIYSPDRETFKSDVKTWAFEKV
jgi:hypothetical protein